MILERSVRSAVARWGGFLCLVFFFVFWPGIDCFGHTIKIRMVNIANGHPLPKQPISIGLIYDKNEKPPANYSAHFQLETDANGEAEFQLPDPAPAHVAAQAHLTFEHWHCGCAALENTQDLIQKGFTAGLATGSTPPGASVKAQPGEILFVARPFTFFERLMYPLTKE